MEVIKLNLIPGKACPVVHVSQFDDGREFKAELYEGVNVYTLDGTETLTAIVKKPDGNEVTAAVTNTSDNYVIITTTEQMTACAGGNLGTLRIEKGAVTIATLNFILECQASPDTGIQSDSEIHNLETQVNQMVEDAVAEQYDSNNVLFDTAPTSGHGVPYAVTSGGLWSWFRDLPLRAYPTASGAIANFDTSLALPLQDLQIAINAIQEGTGDPSPSNVRNLVGFTGANIYDKGVNLWDEVTESGAYSSSNGTKTPDINRIRSVNAIRVIPNATYYIKAPDPLYIYQYKANGDYISYAGTFNNTTYTAPRDCAYIRIGFRTQYGTTYNNDTSINYPATDTAYHAYNPNSKNIPITWNDEAGTVYGAKSKPIVGGLTKTFEGVDMSTLSWTYASGDLRWYTNDLATLAVLDYNNPSFIAEQWRTHAWTGRTEGDIVCNSSGQVFCLTSDSVNPPEGLLVYELATPETYQLTPTQISAIVGTNNIFTDTNGNTSVVYACSLKDYIEGQ